MYDDQVSGVYTYVAYPILLEIIHSVALESVKIRMHIYLVLKIYKCVGCKSRKPNIVRKSLKP